MGYVAIKGGAEAIAASQKICELLRARQGDGGRPIALDDIEHQLRLLHQRVLSEGGVYHPQLASLAIKQAQGDTLEAAFTLRAYRSTVPRLLETSPLDTSAMRITRRISSAFKDIPGGQMLGANTDYHWRLMRHELLNESSEQFAQITREWFAECPQLELDQVPDSFPKVLEVLREQQLIAPLDPRMHDVAPFDITREPLVFPVPRSAALATMSRGEQGALLALAYSNMRGYGDIHPTIAELRVGYLPVMLPHPISGEPLEVGEVEITECEVVAMYQGGDKGDRPFFTLGYGACFGHNEVKAISMAILDRALQVGAEQGPRNPSEDPEFVLLHVDGIDSMGFCTHYKMPHYVTFQSDMDRLRNTQSKRREP